MLKVCVYVAILPSVSTTYRINNASILFAFSLCLLFFPVSASINVSSVLIVIIAYDSANEFLIHTSICICIVSLCVSISSFLFSCIAIVTGSAIAIPLAFLMYLISTFTISLYHLTATLSFTDLHDSKYIVT